MVRHGNKGIEMADYDIVNILLRLEKTVADLQHISEDLKTYKIEHKEDINLLWAEVNKLKEIVNNLNMKVFAAVVCGVAIGAILEYWLLWRMGK